MHFENYFENQIHILMDTNTILSCFPPPHLLGARIFKIFVSNVCWEHGFSKFSYPTFVGSADFQNFRIQRLLGARIFKIFVSNVCWEHGFSKFSSPTFVGCADFQNFPSQQFLGALIFKIFLLKECGKKNITRLASQKSGRSET